MQTRKFGPHDGVSKKGTGPGVIIQNDYYINELEKCTLSPYYFATKYMTINGDSYKTNLTEEQFNILFNSFLKNNTNEEK